MFNMHVIIETKINFAIINIAASTPTVIKIESSDSFQLALRYFTDLSLLILSFPIFENDGWESF